MQYVIQANDLKYSWGRDKPPVLEIDELRFSPGEKAFIEGPSGSGKTTLLSVLGAVVEPQGQLRILDQDTNVLKGSDKDRFRADHIGFIFQMFNLIPYLSMMENVLLPCHFSKKRSKRIAEQHTDPSAEARRLLNHLGFSSGDEDSTVTELSVGQQQRVAVARALIGAPEIIIADEPTSALDAENRESFIQLLFQECERSSATLIFVSHDRSLGDLFDRRISLGSINRPQQ